jgi:hypothetical protein
MNGSVPSHWDTDYKVLPQVKGATWSYSDEAFEAFRKDMQGRSTWNYSGGCDLLLANAKLAPSQDSSELDFEGAVDLKLDEMVKINAITSVETFFGRIFQYAEEASGEDPTWGYSDKEGVGCLKRFVLSLLPMKLGKEAEKAAHFAVRDLKKPATKNGHPRRDR